MTEPFKPNISFEDFMKVDLRIAYIIQATPVEKTDKLMLLTVDLGSEQRQIVAGIKQHYEPQQLIGKSILIVANLEPRSLRGIESHGMLLAASFADPAVESGQSLSIIVPFLPLTVPGTAVH